MSGFDSWHVVEHAIANEYKTSILKDLYRREVTERLTDITEVTTGSSWFDLTVGWAIAKGLSVADANKFAAECRATPQHAAPNAARRLL